MPNGQPGGSALESSPLNALEWRCIGPYRGGRVVAVAGHPVDPVVFYFGAVGGGVWKTTDGGTFWENISDGYLTTAAVGAVAVSDADPNVIYVGTGETTIRGDVSHGDGVYKSTDAGRTWTNMGLSDTRHIAKIRIHPNDPNLVYVAALGHAWGPNRERGVFRSRDGGESWDQILFRSEKAGAIDLSMDPNNPRVLYAALWEAQRSPYSLSSGGPDSSLYKSSDGGDTWIELTRNPGLPTGVIGKIGVAVSPARPDRVWALVEAVDGALFRSDDAGETWERVSEEADLRRRAWYYMHIFADPQDPETCWVLNLACWKSVDGGRTFTSMSTPHGDHHDQWFDPRNPLRTIQGNDGGACISYNGGASWTTLMNQPTAQMYHVTADNQIPYRVYGSQQDNTAVSLPVWSVNGAITQAEVYEPGGGESGYIAVRPDDSNIVFGGAIGSGEGNGRLIRYDHRTGHQRNITVWPDSRDMGDGARALKYRFQWTFPIVISPHDPKLLYVAANRLLCSTDEGGSWKVIGPDLTRNDVDKMGSSGGPITRDNTGVEIYGTIFSFVESPHEQGMFWAGSDDGLIHISRDGGQNWENVTPPDLPEWALISVIEVSPHDPAAAYVAATRYKLDDPKPYLYKTRDYGKTWENIATGIPEHDFTRVVREDPSCRGVLYAGTETGVYVSLDDGASWQRLQGLPVAPIHDLLVRGSDLLAATHGRSFWVLDDVTPLHQLLEHPLDNTARLFSPRPTTRFLVYEGYGGKPAKEVNYRGAGASDVAYRKIEKPDGTTEEELLNAGKNPPRGVIVRYFLPSEVEGEISLTFLDREGNEIRRFSSKKPGPAKVLSPADVEASEAGAPGVEGPEEGPGSAGTAEEKEPRVPKRVGLNRFVWNMRYPSARKVKDDKTMEDLPEGPAVPPGTYQVRLTVGDQSFTESFEIVKDPRVATQEELDEQFKLLLEIRDKVSETHDAVNQLRDVRSQVEGWERRLKNQQDSDRILEAAITVKQALTAVEEELIQVKADSPLKFPTKLNYRLQALAGFIDEIDAAPTRQSYDVFNELTGLINTQLDRFRHITDSDLAALNTMIREASLPAIAPVPISQK